MAKEWPVGRRIVAMRLMTTAEFAEIGWDWPGATAIVLVLDDGSIMFPSVDPEGNGPGMIFFQTKAGKGGMLL